MMQPKKLGGIPTTGDETDPLPTNRGPTPDQELLRGRLGEAVLGAKATGADGVALLAAFLLAFSVQRLMDVAKDDFETPILFEWHFTVICISSSFGFMSVLMLAFLGIKLRRMIGQSAFCFGDENFPAPFSDLQALHGNYLTSIMDFSRGRNDTMGMYNKQDVHFDARYWYNQKVSPVNGRFLYMCAISGFATQLMTFLVAIAIMSFDKSRTPFSDAGFLLGAPFVATVLIKLSDHGLPKKFTLFL
jgi:hypothetical protein